MSELAIADVLRLVHDRADEHAGHTSGAQACIKDAVEKVAKELEIGVGEITDAPLFPGHRQ